MTQEGQSERRPFVVKVSSGNRIGLPREIARQAGIHVGDYIVLTVHNASVIHISKLELPNP